ncbi:MAG TPA: hypothetical protein VF941_12860, partial [Clostridia bacterium]
GNKYSFGVLIKFWFSLQSLTLSPSLLREGPGMSLSFAAGYKNGYERVKLHIHSHLKIITFQSILF